jgi:acyl carrier protein
VFLESLPYGPSGKVRLDVLRPLCEAGSGAGAQDATVEARVMSLARQAFRGHAGELGLASGPDNTMGWDSLAHIEFIAALDDHFGIELGEREIVALTHLGAAVEVVGRRLARG